MPQPRQEITDLIGYAPGEQPAVGMRVVKLNTNEASFDPPPSVVAAAQVSADSLRKYPDPRATKLREVIAERHGLTPDHVLIGNGSDDILTILLRTYVPSGGRVAYPWPTYSLYPTLTQIQGATPVQVDWADGWQLPADNLVHAAADATFVVNPNAPSGTFIEPSEIGHLAKRLDNRLLLIDEAYADYAKTDCVSLLSQHANVAISRSFSKGFALAGVRLGYVLAAPAMIEQMDKVRDSYNVDAVAQAIGLAAMTEAAYYKSERAGVCTRREQLASAVEAAGFDVLPSQANFVFARHADSPRLYRELKKAGIFVRHWDEPDLSEYLRITVGTAAENEALLEKLFTLLKK